MRIPVTLLLLLAVGCGEAPPERPEGLAPVSGEVRMNGQLLSGGMVEFESTEDSNKSAIGRVGEEGRFQLQTRVEGHTFDGAHPGTYRITVFPPMSEQQTEKPLTLKKTLTVTSGDNQINIDASAR